MDQEIKKEFESLTKIINKSFGDLEQKMATKEELASLQKQVDHIENQMVTKDYLDEKLAEHHGNLVILMRKGDAKLLRLVELLKEKNVLSDAEVKGLLEMEPFPKLML